MKAKFVVRPVREEDFEAFMELATTTGGELTNIPGDPEVVRWRIDESILSFDPRVHKAGSNRYLFVLEDSRDGRLVGTCGIISKVGGFQPWYCYDLQRERIAYPPLGIDHHIDVLSPNRNYNGPSEICCLYLLREHRKGGWGRLLSLSRFHFMAEFARRFDRHVIAELRGVTDSTHSSPFWEAVGRPFFQIDFRRADGLSGLDDKGFIEALIPKHPLYVPLLPQSARKVLGRAHPDAEPALKLLEQEGFSFKNQIDVFDAGPIVEAELGDIRTVRERVRLPVGRVVEDETGGEVFIVTNNRLDFRACIGKIDTRGEEELTIDRATARALEVGVGDFVSVSPLRPFRSPEGARVETAELHEKREEEGGRSER